MPGLWIPPVFLSGYMRSHFPAGIHLEIVAQCRLPSPGIRGKPTTISADGLIPLAADSCETIFSLSASLIEQGTGRIDGASSSNIDRVIEFTYRIL